MSPAYSILTFLVFISSPVPASRNEYQTIKQQLEVEKIPGDNPGDPPRSFHSLSLADQAQMEKKRLQGVFYNSAVNVKFQYRDMKELDNDNDIDEGVSLECFYQEGNWFSHCVLRGKKSVIYAKIKTKINSFLLRRNLFTFLFGGL